MSADQFAVINAQICALGVCVLTGDHVLIAKETARMLGIGTNIQVNTRSRQQGQLYSWHCHCSKRFVAHRTLYPDHGMVYGHVYLLFKIPGCRPQLERPAQSDLHNVVHIWGH